MSQDPQDRFIEVKAYEVGYAVFRLAGLTTKTSFRDYLEHQALALLNAAVSQNYSSLGVALRSLEYLIRFGGDVGAIHPENSTRVIAELGSLQSALQDVQKPEMSHAVNLDDIFSSIARPSEGEMEREKEESDESGNGMTGIIKSGMRQSAILERIRQTGNCKLRDIQEILPECSERTIRYDLQSLLSQNLIERIGNGGPAVYYRIRQTA